MITKKYVPDWTEDKRVNDYLSRRFQDVDLLCSYCFESLRDDERDHGVCRECLLSLKEDQ